MSTKKIVTPRKQKGTGERKRPAHFTPPGSNKKQKDISEETVTEEICQVCEAPIVEYSATSEGEEAVFCEGLCNAWIHRKCSGLTSGLFDIVSESNEPFRCCYCMLTHQRNEINTLKSLVESLRLGKYHEQLKQPRLLLVKLNRSSDVPVLLLKARSLPNNIRLKPDRLVESLLLKERWSLIQSNVDRKLIKIRNNKIFVKKKLHGQVINSTFVLSPSQHVNIPMDSSSN